MQPLYITTPLYYVNDAPHVGHAYTTVIADAIARQARARGRRTFFLTGTDEHGQKIEEAARARGKAPKAFADDVVERFKATWETLHVSYDDFIRTTEPRHEKVVTWLWRRLADAGDIYLGDYEAWYCVACEAFYTDNQLEAGACPTHKRPVSRVKERSYFFRMGRYQQRLIDHIESNPTFVTPASRRSEVLAFLKGEPLRDLSISRTSFRWGIPVPGDPDHVIYVWLDALTNYISALDAPDGERYRTFWENAQSIHLLGKDILRFHAVIWPCMLLGAGLPLPKTVATHGWWTARGQKIAKSMPATRVDPNMLAADLGADALRYFLLREVPLGADGDFSYEALLGRYKADLGNDLGNLLNRCLGIAKQGSGEVPRAEPDATFARTADDTVRKVEAEWEALAPSRALEATFALVRAANEYVDKSEPWALRKRGETARLDSVTRTFLEACAVIGKLVAPALPERGAALCRQLGYPDWDRAAGSWPVPFGGNLPEGQRLGEATPLFPRLDPDKESALLEKWIPRETTMIPPPGATPTTARQAAKDILEYSDFEKLDLCVARVEVAERIPKSDKLLRLELDVGGERRQVVAGIATAYAPETLVGRQVLFLRNLKPAKIRGVESQGMVLAAGDEQVLALSTLDREVPAGTKVR